MRKSIRNIYLYESQTIDEENEIITFDIGPILEEMKKDVRAYSANTSQDDRYFGIEEIKKKNNAYLIKLISCRYNYLPDILNVNTQGRRASDKTPEEGDVEYTHVIVSGSDIYYERNRGGTPVNYFQKFINIANKAINSDSKAIKISQVLQNDFFEKLEQSSRIKNLKILTERSDRSANQYFNFHDENLRKEEEIIFKAERNKSLSKNNVINFLRNLTDNSEIIKATVDIDDENNNSQVINNDSFSVVYKVEVELLNSGLVNSDLLYIKVVGLL